MTIEMKRVEEIFEQKGVTLPQCPCCKKNGWTLGTDFLELRTYHSGKMDAYEKSSPFLPYFCSNCGYTVLHSAVILGLVPKA